MHAQETVTNAIANLFGNIAAVFVAVAALAVLAAGADQVLQLVDVRLPVRQFLAGRSLQTLTLSCRFFFVPIVSHITAKLPNPRFRDCGARKPALTNGDRTSVTGDF